MKKIIVLIALAVAVGFIALYEEGKHDHAHGDGHEHGEEHGDDHGHGDEDGHGHDHGHGGGNVGPGKAVTETDHDGRFRLSDAAIRALGIETIVIEDPAAIPPRSLVRHQDEVSVYWLQDGWFKRIRPGRVEAGDVLVVKGADLLRVVELDLFTEDVEGHSH